MRTAAFSLIELLIVLVISAILMAIAIPSYQHYVAKTRRTEAKTALLSLATRMEAYYSEHHRYTDSNGASLTSSDLDAPTATASGAYQLHITTTPHTYLLSAIPDAAQREHDALCGTLTLNQAGQEGAMGTTTTPAQSCW